MVEQLKLSTKTLELQHGSFGDLLHSPYELDFGSETLEEETISVKDLQIRLGDRPIAKNVRRLYELGHRELPPDLAVFDAYDIWLIVHTFGALRRRRGATIQAIGYQANFEDDEQVYTIDLLPQSKFKTTLEGSFENQADLGVEGHAKLPEETTALLDSLEYLGGDAQIKLSSALKVIGRISFSIISPIIQTVGLGSSRIEWCFDVDQEPLLGDQVMLQTVLVPQHTETIKFKIRGYALIKTNWISFPAMFRTTWVPIDCPLV